MRRCLFSVTLVVMLLAGVHAQTPPPPAPVAGHNLANWKEFMSAEGGFTVSMPGTPTVTSVPVDTEVGRIVMHLYVLTTRFGEFGVTYSDLPLRSHDSTATRRFLDGSRDEMLANGAKMLNENDVTVDGMVGRELITDNQGVTGRHWIFLVDARMYAVILATPPNVAFTNGKPSSNPSDRTDLYETTCRRFFGSFKFTKSNVATSTPEQANDGVLEPITGKTDLYPANAEANKEIDEALEKAVKDKKRVMLIFGANWCYDCHVLDRALHEGTAGEIVKKSFVLVHVDIGEGEKNPDLLKTYKIPLDKGVPAIAVLASNGRLLYSSGDGEFEAARKIMKRDLVAFLLRWKAE